MATPQALSPVSLAGQAATLSSELYALQDNLKPQSSNTATSEEISTIADELARLSTTLWHLNDAINVDPTQYTDAFNEDLREITVELAAVFEEIEECAAGLQDADSNISVASWFFKKGRVSRLLKHLEALKGTLVVMRTVLWHGKDYGTHTSDRIAESSPHTMHEDRVILESVLARNRDAILDLHNLANTLSATNAETRSTSIVRTPSKAGDHHRRMSESTGVDIPPIPDVLPPGAIEEAANEERGTDQQTTTDKKLRRTFSKRGVRLGVHMSILDLSAHEAPTNLKKKWIQQAHLRQRQHGQQPGNGNSHGDRRGLTALPELSRISEVDTTAGSMRDLNFSSTISPPELTVGFPALPENPIHDPTPIRTPDVLTSTLAEPLSTNIRKSRSSTVGSKLRQAMSKISISNLRSPTLGRSRSKSQSQSQSHDLDSSESSGASNLNPVSKQGREKDASPARESSRNSVSASPRQSQSQSVNTTPKASSSTRTRPNPNLNLNLNLRKENAPLSADDGKKSFLDVLKQRFERSPLTTPDVEREFENGRF